MLYFGDFVTTAASASSDMKGQELCALCVVCCVCVLCAMCVCVSVCLRGVCGCVWHWGTSGWLPEHQLHRKTHDMRCAFSVLNCHLSTAAIMAEAVAGPTPLSGAVSASIAPPAAASETGFIAPRGVSFANAAAVAACTAESWVVQYGSLAWFVTAWGDDNLGVRAQKLVLRH